MNVRTFALFTFCATLILLLGMIFTVALAAPGQDSGLPPAASTPVGFPPYPTPPVPIEPPAPPSRMELPMPGQDAPGPRSQIERLPGDRLPEGWRNVLAQGGTLPDWLTAGISPEEWGGPDTFGYTYADSDEPWGPDPTFEDISAIGTAVDLTDFYTVVPLPFAFPFYGSTYAEVYLYGDCLNCWNYWTHLAFGGPDPYSYGGSVRWMDYIDRDSGTVYVYSDTLSSPARFIVQYDEVWNYGYGITTTSQVVLYESGDILVRYQDEFDWWSWYWWESAPWLFRYYTSFQYPGDPRNNLAVQFYYPQGAWLWPPEQTQAAPAGGETSYLFDLHNDTGATDSFDLTVDGYVWPTYVSPTQTGPIADGSVVPIQVLVDLPPGTMPGDTDAATIHAASVTSPGIYSDTATINTIAVCTPSLIFGGQSDQAVSHDDVFDYGGQGLTHLYVEAHTTSDWPTMYATLLGYDPGLGTWQTLGEWQSIGPHYLLIDQYDIPPVYSAVRLQLRDTWGLPAYYDYQFIACREPAVALHPLAQQALALPGTTVVYTQTVTNYTMGPDSFDLSVAGNAWPTTFWDGPTPIDNTGPLADLEAFTFTVQVELPAGMGAEYLDMATIQATSAASPGIYDTASLRTSLLAHPWAQAFSDGWAPDGSPDGEQYLDIVRPTGAIRAQLTDDTDWQYEAPAVAAYPRDALVAAWQSAYRWNGTVGYYNIEYAGLDVDGNVVISTTQVSDNAGATLYTYEWNPTLAVAPTDGNVLFAWTRYESDGMGNYLYNVYYAVRGPAGAEVLPPTALTSNSTMDVQDSASSVAAFGDGYLAVAWQHWDNTASASDVYYAVLDSAGGLVASPTNLTQNNPGDYIYEPRANRLADGNVLLTWHGAGGGIYYAVLDSAGDVVYPVTQLANSMYGTYAPDAVGLRNGNTIVVWQQHGSYPNWGRHIGYAVLDSAYQAPTNPGEGPWTGSYYNDEALTEPPVLVRTDDTISFFWDMGSPDPVVNDDYFSVRWTGTITVPAGSYEFTMGSDDGSRLWIDDQLVLDHWDECCTYWQTVVPLAEGPHDVKMEMHEHDGAAWAQLTWQHLLLNPASDENYDLSLTRDGQDNAVLTWRDDEWRIHYALFADDGSVLGQPAIYYAARSSDFNIHSSGAGNGTLPGPELRIHKTATPNPVEAGALLTYTLVVENIGNTQATGVTITDAIPAHTTFARADEGGALVGDQVEWTGKTVAAGEELTVTFAATVTAPLTNGTLIANLAYGVVSAEGATATGDPVTTTVESTPVLSLTKTAAPDPVEAGGLLTYTLVVANGGNADATGVIITDTIPTDTTFVSATAGGALVGSEVQWTGQAVPAGASLTVQFVVGVDSSLAAGATLANSDYGVRCTQVLTPVMGTPVTTGVVVTHWRTYLPIVLRRSP